MPNILVERAFTDDKTHRLFSPGVWPVDDNTAKRLIANGRAVKEGSKAAPKAAEVKLPELAYAPRANGGKTQESEEPQEETTGTPLPEDFPSRDVLLENGFTTVEQLREPDVKDKLLQIDGLGEARVTKIGLAVSELK